MSGDLRALLGQFMGAEAGDYWQRRSDSEDSAEARRADDEATARSEAAEFKHRKLVISENLHRAMYGATPREIASRRDTDGDPWLGSQPDEVMIDFRPPPREPPGRSRRLRWEQDLEKAVQLHRSAGHQQIMAEAARYEYAAAQRDLDDSLARGADPEPGYPGYITR